MGTAGRYGGDLRHARHEWGLVKRCCGGWGIDAAGATVEECRSPASRPVGSGRPKRLLARPENREVAFDMLHIAGMPPVYDRWLNGAVPTWASLKADRIDALRGIPAWEDGAIRLAFDLTDDEIACSPIVQNALVLMRAANQADGLELTARGNLTRETVAAMRSAMDWPGLLFEDKWREGKRLREGHVEELRLVRELAVMNGLVIRKKGRLRVGATGRRALKDRRERLQASLFRDCFWQVNLGLFGEPECGSWPQGLIGPALWSLAATGDRWQDTQTLMRLSVLPDEAVLRNPEWVARALFVLRVLRPLSWFGLVESRDEDASRRGRGEWRKTPLFDRFLTFDPKIVRAVEGTVH